MGRNNTYLDLTGQRFGSLTVVCRDDDKIMRHYQSKHRRDVFWVCICDCGREKYGVRTQSLVSGVSTHCGCQNKNIKNLVGMRFGRLIVIEQTSDIKPITWLCQCDCGNLIVKSTQLLKSGHSNSCGCYRHEYLKEIHTTHKYSTHRYASTWYMMMDRCYNCHNRNFHNYGGRGIIVCDAWHDIATFCDWADAQNAPSEFSLDRCDVNGGYSPDNCRFISHIDQCNNTRRNVFLELNGEKHTIAEWARSLGVSYARIRSRYKRGWPIERVLFIE